MSKLPELVDSYLKARCVGIRSPAYLRIDPGGILIEWGGECERYGLDDLSCGVPATDRVDFLAGLLPLPGASLTLPLVATSSDARADIHLFPHAGDCWVVLLDASATAREQRELQQKAHDLDLLREQQAKLLSRLQDSHEQLQTVLDQLGVIVAIVNASGHIEFLSRAAVAFYWNAPPDVIGEPWDTVLPFDEEDLPGILHLLSLAPRQRDRLTVRARAATGHRRWMELEVLNDPRNSERRILYMYDLSPVRESPSPDLPGDFCGMSAKCASMHEVFELIRDLSPLDSTVLIQGETGTGKELVARAVHSCSLRKNKPFVVVNCAGLSDSLINSQLFGHSKGAFTDAISDQKGLFEAAHGGTILLDEIGDIPMNTQTRILRVLEEREITRIGETKPRRIDVRVLAATNRNLDEAVARADFRLDLLYRIRVARVDLPPLRQRREDIPLLAGIFLRGLRATTGKQIDDIGDDAMRLLRQHEWTGNVRELRNAIEFAVIKCKEKYIRPRDLPPEITRSRLVSVTPRTYDVEVERERILDALQHSDGRRNEAAELLGISRATLYRRMKACGLNPTAPR